MERKPDPEPYEGPVALIVTIGTMIWAFALADLLLFWNTLKRDGHLWWIAVCAVGVVLGLVGRTMVVRRDRRVGRTEG